MTITNKVPLLSRELFRRGSIREIAVVEYVRDEEMDDLAKVSGVAPWTGKQANKINDDHV